MDIINAQDEDMRRVVEGVLGFYGGCAAREDRDMAQRVLSAIAGEQKRRADAEQADAESEAQHRYEQSQRETRAILESRAAMAALPLRVAAHLARPSGTPEMHS